MKDIYALEFGALTEGVNSVFLAGPTPRNKSVASWRPDMIKMLRDKGYEGDILIPEKRGNFMDYDYHLQTDWEVTHLNQATKILFWIPRELKHMPAFTTNIEFGEFMHSGKVILAYPKDAPKMRYLQVRADGLEIPVFHTMDEAAYFVAKSLAV